MFDGDGVRSAPLLLGTASVFGLFAWLGSLAGERSGLRLLLPPVRSLLRGAALPFRAVLCAPVPTLVAARSAPFPPPVYVLGCGFGFTGGLEKAEEAEIRAAFRTLYWVSPVVCGPWDKLRPDAEVIESPLDLSG